MEEISEGKAVVERLVREFCGERTSATLSLEWRDQGGSVSLLATMRGPGSAQVAMALELPRRSLEDLDLGRLARLSRDFVDELVGEAP